MERRQQWLAAMEPIEPIRTIGCAHARFYFQSALRDEVISTADARAFQGAAPQPKTTQWYDMDHNLGLPNIFDELAWLHQTIGTAPPRAREALWCWGDRCKPK